MIVIDIDILIEIYDKQSTLGKDAFEKIMGSGDTFCITVINLQEALYGLLKYSKPSELPDAIAGVGLHQGRCKADCRAGQPVRRPEAGKDSERMR